MNINKNLVLKIVLAVILIFVSALIFYSKYAKENKEEVDVTTQPQVATQQSSGSEANDTLFVKGITAVFFRPSLEWIERMKKIDEEGFYAGADDAMYYSVIAEDFLKNKNIKTVDTFARYLDFIKDNGQHVIIDRNSKNSEEFWWAGPNNEGWGLFLFDGKQDPLRADITIIESGYEKYFK